MDLCHRKLIGRQVKPLGKQITLGKHVFFCFAGLRSKIMQLQIIVFSVLSRFLVCPAYVFCRGVPYTVQKYCVKRCPANFFMGIALQFWQKTVKMIFVLPYFLCVAICTKTKRSTFRCAPACFGFILWKQMTTNFISFENFCVQCVFEVLEEI